MILLGSLILLRVLGVFPPLNADSELGLLLVLTSLQMLALGEVVGSHLTRSWLSGHLLEWCLPHWEFFASYRSSKLSRHD